ncbi:Fe-S cluster assembly protein SufD [Candidatus Woesearchaeota archaeon]|nr:Fe-S cluster assembly protein SufD [Candidatus Woesearchaeota archaeon]
MMQATQTEGESLNKDAVRKLSKAKKEPEWLLQQRLAALKAYRELPEAELKYGLHVMAAPNIVIEDLHLLENLTTHSGSKVSDVVVEDLSIAAAKYESLLKPIITSGKYQDRLEALFAASWNNGIFIHAPKRKVPGEPVNVHLQLKQKQTELVAIVVVAEENSNLFITESLTQTEAKGQSYRIQGTGVMAGANATIKFATVQKLGKNANCHIIRRGVAQHSARIDWVDITTGGGFTRQETTTALNEEGASSTITGAFFGEDSQQLDIQAKQIHNARNTSSNIRIKGALQGKAKAIVQSFTKIMEQAANSAGHQKANVLLLSDSARASPIPKLEIDNYDVKASHEASVGQLDKEKLFYLMSRGMDNREAATLAVEGFFEPLLRELPTELAEDIRSTIKSKLNFEEETQ